MPVLYLAALIAVYVDGRTVEDVALGFGIPEPTVRSRLNRAITHLRERLKGREHEFRGILPVALLAALRSERGNGAVPVLPAPPMPSPAGIKDLVGAALGGGLVGAGILAALWLGGPDRLFAERSDLEREHERLSGLAQASAMVEQVSRPTVPSCPRPSVSDPPQKAHVVLSGQAKQKVTDIMSKRSENPAGWR
jgi:hypothetical protein